jgi:hypothetical protein
MNDRLCSERGSVVLLVAFSTVALLGIAALSVDASFMFDLRQKMSAAADAAAKTAAFEVKRGFVANVQPFAQAEIDRHVTDGLLPSGVVVNAHLCNAVGATCTSPYNTAKYVEVILSKTHPTFFGTIAGYANLMPVARAVAGTAQPEACFVTMEDLYMKNAQMNMDDCGVQVGGDVTFDNTPSDIVGPLSITGGCSGGGGGGGEHCAESDVATGQPYPENPFKNLGPPTTAPATCPNATGSGTLAPGCYNNIPNTITTLQAGIYTIKGTLDIANLTATSGTLLYFTSTGVLTAGNNAELHLTASNTITGYEGIAIYGDAGSSWDMGHTNSFDVWIKGAVVMSGSDVEIKNGLTMHDTGCSVMVFKSWTQKAGNGFLGADQCATLFSNASYLGVSLAE